MLNDRRYRAAAATAAANILGRPVNMLLSMAAVAIAVRSAGQEAYGVMVMCLTATTWLAALDCGLSSSSINRIVQVRTGGEPVQGVVSTAFFFLLAVGMMTALAIAWAAYCTGLPDFLNPGHGLPRWQVQGCLLAFAAYVFCWFPCQIFERASVAFQEGWLTVVGQVGGNAIGLGFLVATIAVAPTLPGVAGAWVGGACVSGLAIVAATLLRHPRECLPSWQFASGAELRRLMNAGAWFILIGLAGQVGLQSDPLIAGIATNALEKGDGAAVAAELAIPMRLFNFVTAFAILAINPLWPAYAEAAAKGDSVWLRRTLRKSTLIAAGSSFLAVLPCVIFGRDILRLWVGDQVHVPLGLIVACACWTVAMTVGQSFNVFLNGLGFFRLQFAVNVLFLALVIPAKILALWRFGPAGMVCATAAIYVLTQIIPYFLFIRAGGLGAIQQRQNIEQTVELGAGDVHLRPAESA